MQINKNTPKNFKNEIYEEYIVNSLTTGQIAKKYNLLQISVQKHLKSKNLLKNVSEGTRKYNYDKTLFDNINSHWKAYFLGWLYSDGNVYIGAKKYTISLCISEKDKYILDFFNKKIFNSLKPLNYRKAQLKKGTEFMCNPLYRFQIDSKYMVENLIFKGLVPNKSHIITFPDYISNEYIFSFIQGVFEGDGCISNNNGYSKTISIASGSKKFIIKIKELLNLNSIYPNIYEIKKSNYPILYDLHFGKKKEVLKFKELIYKNSEIKLERKYERFNY